MATVTSNIMSEKIGMTLKDSWSASSTYSRLDVVRYNSNCYVARHNLSVSGTNYSPEYNEHWMQLTNAPSSMVDAGLVTRENLLDNWYFVGGGSQRLNYSNTSDLPQLAEQMVINCR